MPGNRTAFPGMLGRDTAQNRRADRGWVDSCMGREVRAVSVSPLQHRVVVSSRIPRSQALIAAPKAHPLQDLGGRARPPRGLAG
eukprot:14987211-Alexandrium_andersonii.AAC.1